MLKIFLYHNICMYISSCLLCCFTNEWMFESMMYKGLSFIEVVLSLVVNEWW